MLLVTWGGLGFRVSRVQGLGFLGFKVSRV